MTLLAGAVSVYSQGAVSLNDYNGGNSGFKIQVFQPQPLASSPVLVSVNGQTSYYEEMGNPANTYMPTAHQGTSVYPNSPSTIGPTTDIALYASDSTGATSFSQLAIASPIVNTWYNSSYGSKINNNYGIWKTSVSASVPGSATAGSVAIAAWQNTGPDGAASTLAEAQADGYAWGISSIVNSALTTGSGSPATLPTTITSFSEVVAVSTPEPSTIALGVIGASTLLFRRKK